MPSLSISLYLSLSLFPPSLPLSLPLTLLLSRPPESLNGSGGVQDSDEDELVIGGCNGTFSADLPHVRAQCVTCPHRIVNDRVGVEGDNNEQVICVSVCVCVFAIYIYTYIYR